MQRSVNSDRDSDRKGQRQTEAEEQTRVDKALVDDVECRLAVIARISEIALHRVAEPGSVSVKQRLVKAMNCLEAVRVGLAQIRIALDSQINWVAVLIRFFGPL